jgi:hypothetical protein
MILLHDGDGMKIPQLRAVLLSILGIAVTLAWALVIAVAVHISTVVLNTLQMIVDLAAMS